MTTIPTERGRMQCMEVWGGNQAVDRAFETAGLKIWVFSQPFGQASGGGDVYYISSCASGRITRVLLGDVSGHGEAVSGIAVALRDLMRQNVNYIRQSRFVEAMNQQFAAYGQQDVFATGLVSTFFAPTRTFTLCNAGHPEPFLFRQNENTWKLMRNAQLVSGRVSDIPFGIQEEAIYGELEVKLRNGDMVLSFSDAVTEAKDHSGRPLGAQGVLGLVHELNVTTPESVIPQLTDRLAQLHPDNLRDDDATLLLMQSTGGSATLKNNLLAPFRLFGPVSDRTKIQ